MTVVLGIESSCDETAVALVRDGHAVLAEAVASQADDFATWGGVVPELAARGHVAALPGLVQRVLDAAGLPLAAVGAVAVGAWPGLIGSLLTGVTAAKAIAIRRGLPLAAVDHIQAHLAAVHLGRPEVPYPFIGLVASGGHSHLYRCAAPGALELIGGTIDDAAGEAFDKAAATLDLGYPGGPQVDRLAASGDPRALALPRSFLKDDTLRLSFAGLKTALLYQVRGPLGRDPLTLSAPGRARRLRQLPGRGGRLPRRQAAPGRAPPSAWAPSPWAAASPATAACARASPRSPPATASALLLPEPRHCADNAAMIASLGHFQVARGDLAGPDLAPLPTGRAGPRRAAQGSG